MAIDLRPGDMVTSGPALREAGTIIVISKGRVKVADRREKERVWWIPMDDCLPMSKDEEARYNKHPFPGEPSAQQLLKRKLAVFAGWDRKVKKERLRGAVQCF